MKYRYLLIRLAALLAVLAAIWAPEFLHSHIDRTLVPLKNVQESMSDPSNLVLEEVADISFAVSLGIADENLVAVASELLAGRLIAPDFFEKTVPLRGYPLDLQYGPPTFQLAMASLAVDDVLLRAYERSRDQRFFKLAMERVLAFSAFEAAQIRASGFLWNDHAIAARISVLARLWRHARERPEVSTESRQSILSLAERSGRLLAKADHFTVRTNHGVMQILALLQTSAAFPRLPEAVVWRQLAVERLRLQLGFYVSREGFVLEHSAGYHYFGFNLLLMANRLQVLNGLTPDSELVAAVRRARAVLDQLMRPDGSLPVFGNTASGAGLAIPTGADDGSMPLATSLPPHHAPADGATVFPLSAYAVWWSRKGGADTLAQTVIAWAKHDGHGHKHADEASVFWWSNGIDWLTNTGYWPYGDRLTDAAYGWQASNAPHEVGESAKSRRTVRLLKTGDGDGVRFIDIERSTETGARFRRQVLQLDQATLIVLDFSAQAHAGTEAIWTVSPPLRLFATPDGKHFLTSPAGDGRRLAITVAALEPPSLGLHRGSERPFAGWVVVGSRPTPADALRILQTRPETAAAVLFRVSAPGDPSDQDFRLEAGSGAEKWGLTLSTGHTSTSITRDASQLVVRSESGRAEKRVQVDMPLLAAADIEGDREKLKRAYSDAVSAYPQWRELAPYRSKLSILILILGACLEIVLLAARRLVRGFMERHYGAAHVVVLVAWALVTIWALALYLP